MSSCHHAVKDFCMIHTNKNKGTRRQKTGALMVIQKNAISTGMFYKLTY